MFDQLSKFGLPVKYAVIGFLAGVLGAVIGHFMDFFYAPETKWITPFATMIGGAVGGYIREKRGFKS